MSALEGYWGSIVYAVSISFVISAKAHPIHHGRQSAWAAATLAAISGDGGAEGVASSYIAIAASCAVPPRSSERPRVT
jgi:hypothetical protein